MRQNQLSVHPWPREAAPNEGEIRRLLEAEGLSYGLPEKGEQVELRVGDRLELPPGIVHDALVGSQGVACLEARRP